MNALTHYREDIAVVSMTGRFPGADDCDALWQSICEGKELLQTYPAITPQPDGWVPRGAYLSDAESFDHAQFRYTPREASRMDPQQRLCLVLCRAALNQAGYRSGAELDACAVFVGTRADTWHDQYPANDHSASDAMLTLGGRSSDAMATRVAYKLDCRGPAVNIANFCSGSLLAVHMACNSLYLGECDMALAGGVCVRYPAHVGYRYNEGGILSATGKVRPFDQRADGTVFADAAGFVGLRRLSDALRDGNPLLGVIKGSAVNNDGLEKAGYTAPNVKAQEAVINAALTRAGVSAGQVGLLEAHGTGTAVGDAVELRALSRVFDAVAPRSCALGALKANLGHTDCASGISGLIKALQAVRLGVLPASTHCEQPCAALLDPLSPFDITAHSRPWPKVAEQRLAGVSSFGIGGTNVHVIVGGVSSSTHPG
ncbi:polyketide synthase [Pseudomonas sp. S75]|uniref:beta-ketoacyl [acyl carrier protein] synthase domain-containing protein n=1 Tax=unclassified Pseudomonas TaxID=196821 RepID=UPI001906E9FB|nr:MULTISPECIES: polyketide synthase [unclassified Pseudomonas]MBJ9975372.1 polyketide synthase [Pseudomonas sp. S30]MBK0152654.1 polyketide synthase [Pseudomonas sp. S75]